MIIYIDRKTGQKEEEKIYYGKLLRFFYGKSRLGNFLARVTARVSLFSKIYGFFQNSALSRRKIAPFIKKYHINTEEFEKKVEQFHSFNDFFTRTLKQGARKISSASAIIPADGRYLCYPDLDAAEGFVIKGEKFSLAKLLGSQALAEHYGGGSLIIGRLCPSDYHRFHFPCDCTPSHPRVINGPLYSVNPLALAQNLSRFAENKRVITSLKSPLFGTLLFIEVGAMNVGSICESYTPSKSYQKGEEKGFFSFGGSAIVLLFEKNRLALDEDLQKNSAQHIETLCLMGQSLGEKK